MKIYKIGWRKFIIEFDYYKYKDIKEFKNILSTTFPKYKFVLINQY